MIWEEEEGAAARVRRAAFTVQDERRLEGGAGAELCRQAVLLEDLVEELDELRLRRVGDP